MPHQRCRCYFSLQDSVATTVMVNDKEVNVRTITVEDRTGKVKVSLWRNIAAEPVVLGDVVAITNIVVNSKRYNNEESLSSTQFTKIEVNAISWNIQTYMYSSKSSFPNPLIYLNYLQCTDLNFSMKVHLNDPHILRGHLSRSHSRCKIAINFSSI